MKQKRVLLRIIFQPCTLSQNINVLFETFIMSIKGHGEASRKNESNKLELPELSVVNRLYKSKKRRIEQH